LITEEDDVVLLLGSNADVSDTSVRQLVERIVTDVATRIGPETVSAGISESCKHPQELRHSFVDAGRALESATILRQKNAVVLFSELGILSILLRRSNSEELQEFSRKYLAPLIAYDEIHEGGLLKTLQAYIHNDFHPYEAARELAVHRKTVEYRLEKIEELCGVDLGKSDDRMNLQIAFRLYNLFGH
jgi:purine catabolism regulator